jgi:hypothetical protein
MLKALVFLKKRPDISREAFISYYENHHSKLVRRLLPSIGEYRRNYLQLEGKGLRAHGEVPKQEHPGFDVVTEIWFKDKADWDTFLQTIARPEVAAEIAADELNFLDRANNRLVAVDEFIHPD